MKTILSYVCLLFSAALWAQSKSTGASGAAMGWRLKNSDVLRVVEQSARSAEIDLTGARISFSPDFRTRSARPQLELLRIARTANPHLLLASLRCRAQAECRSFMVEILLSRPGEKDAGNITSPMKSHRAAGGTRGAKRDEPVLVAPGRVALLLSEEDGVRITEEVRPARPAHLGEVVRVADTTTHRWLRAQVTGPGAVRLVKAAHADAR